MQIVASPDLPPGACYITGRNEGPFLDTDLMIDDLPIHGKVYLAVSFLSDALDVIGGLGPEATAILREKLRLAELSIAELHQANDSLTDALNGLLSSNYANTSTNTTSSTSTAVIFDQEAS